MVVRGPQPSTPTVSSSRWTPLTQGPWMAGWMKSLDRITPVAGYLRRLKGSPERADPLPMRSLCILVLASLLFVPAAWGQDAEQDAAAARLEENWTSYQNALARLAELEAVYTRGMTSRDLVGEPREKVVAGIAKAKQEIATSREAHAELFEAARRAGVPWNVLDRYEELPAPPASPRPTSEWSPDDITVGSENVDALSDAASEDSDALEGESENADDAPEDEGENLDAIDDGESEDSDDMRATSRDPD